MELKVLAPQTIELSSQEEMALPIILRDKVLLSPGNWNGIEFTKQEIKNAFLKTDWKDKENYALIYDHDERAVNWLGNVVNPRFDEATGSLIGDLEFWDENVALKLTKGGAKLGISAKVYGIENMNGELVNFTFRNFSVVYTPACKKAYINLSQNKELSVEIISKLHEVLKLLEEGVPHPTEKIKYGDEEDLGAKFEKTIQDIKDSLRKAHPDWDEEKIKSVAYATANAKKIPKDMSDSDYSKGGLEISAQMEESKPVDVEQVTETPEVKEEAKTEEVKTEEVKEEPKTEEVKEEVKPEATTSEEKLEEVKPEEKTEEIPAEQSNESEKELNDKFSSILESIKKLSEDITTLSTKVAKLEEEEASEESEEEAKEEELSEKTEPKVMSIALQTSPASNLLSKQLSPGEMRLAEVLYKNAARNV